MMQKFTRRLFLGSVFGAGLLALLPFPARADEWVRFNFLRKRGDNFPYKLSENEWRKKLGDEAYAILRDGENEKAGSSPLLRERAKGTYVCGGCDQPVFDSSAKVMANDWPTFRQPLSRKAIGLSNDFGIILPRTEVHCSNCGGHLGYRFAADNATETWRFVINGSSLRLTRI